MLTLTTSPRIYVACLAAYNNGFLHGTWIDADQDADDIYTEVQEMLKTSPAWKIGDICEEWAIHDYEGFEDIRLSEFEDFETVADLAQAIADHGPAFTQYYSTVTYGNCVADTVAQFNEDYRGVWNSEAMFVEQCLEDDGTLDAVEAAGLNPSYIDLEAIARDWFINDYFSAPAPNYQVFVYRRS